MKRIIPYLMSFILITITSCNKWLDVRPQNEQVSDMYWENKEEVDAVLGAAYVKLQDAMDEMIVWGEARGNGLALGGFIRFDVLRFKMFDLTPSNNLVSWAKFYQIINFSNMVIKYAPEVMAKDPSFNEAVMNSALSEAYFLRGLSYFYLVRNFKEVPLIMDPYMNDNNSFEIAKSSEEEVYAAIQKDFEMALGSSKEIWPNIWETKGRSTRWSIYAALADVYLWTGQYDEAIKACDAVINSGRVGLIEGKVNNENRWFTIFNPGNSNEGIFEVQFDFSKNQTNKLMEWFGSSYAWQISTYMVSLFEQSSEDIRGAGATYTNGDYKIWKYNGAEGSTGIPRANNDQNWIIYRMADIYLMKAEALVMKGESNYDAAAEIINMIRNRAGISQPISSASTEIEMLDLVLNEKAKEFVGEGKRWYDLLRIGKRNDYRHKDYFINQVLLGSSVGSTTVIHSKLLNESSHYLPIHIKELEANRLLVQNPYYENLN